MTKLWIMKTWRQKIWFIGICGHPKRVRGLETKEAHFRSIPPLLWAQKIHPSYELHPKFYENYSDQLYSRRGKNPIYIQTDSFQGWKFQMVNPTEKSSQCMLRFWKDIYCNESTGLRGFIIVASINGGLIYIWQHSREWRGASICVLPLFWE